MKNATNVARRLLAACLALLVLVILTPSCALMSPETRQEIEEGGLAVGEGLTATGNAFQEYAALQAEFLEDDVSPGVIDPVEAAQLQAKLQELGAAFGGLGQDLEKTWGSLREGLRELDDSDGWLAAGQVGLQALLAALGIPVSVFATNQVRDSRRKKRGEAT